MNQHEDTSELGEIVIDTVDLKRRPVKLVGKHYGIAALYAEQRDKHLTRTAKHMRYDENGKAVGMGDLIDFQADLIAQSLRDENDKPVPITTIRKWPGSVQEKLAVAIQAISGLSKGKAAAVDAAK